MAGMTPLLLLLLWLGLTGSTEVNIHKRILGGHQCRENERNYHVRLEMILPNGMAALCGGSLVSDQWVLTAAHCWEKGWIMFAVVGVNRSETQTVEIRTEPIVYVNKKRHDLMLVKLPYPTNIIPVPMCGSVPLKNDDKVQVAGNAATTTDGNNGKIFGQTDELQCADMKVVSCDEERNNLKNTDKEFYDLYEHQHWICAKGSNSKTDICKGDSGGGLVDKAKALHGVAVFGDDRAFKEAAVFLDICNDEYQKWIQSIIKPGSKKDR